ncbi:MAG: nucleotidyl transferase AbiEii/AbiGii toxin family protein [Solirubrobacterales bacterium]|nr:nucleotidyl transferase AbiEii/AbiGii toxin family protein [Solirubrobacterales bacterium]
MSEQILPEKGPNRRPDQTPERKAHLERLVDHYARLTGLAPVRVRGWISVMVLLGALDRSRESDPLFLLKGGVAIELRVGGGARATKDVDLVFFGDPERLGEILDEDLGEPYSVFSFERKEVETRVEGLFRQVDVKLLFRGRGWATLKLEVAQPDSRTTDGEEVDAIPIDEFGIEGPRMVRCLSLRYQIAQKLHAVTQGFEEGENERFRDLIDLIICRDLVANLGEVREACIDTFDARNLHAWPPTLHVPDGWAEPYTALAEEMDFPVTDVVDAATQVRDFISKIDAS